MASIKIKEFDVFYLRIVSLGMRNFIFTRLNPEVGSPLIIVRNSKNNSDSMHNESSQTNFYYLEMHVFANLSLIFHQAHEFFFWKTNNRLHFPDIQTAKWFLYPHKLN